MEKAAEPAEKAKVKETNPEQDEVEVKPLDEGDLKLLMRYGKGPYDSKLKSLEDELKELN